MKQFLATCLVAGGALLGQAAKADIIFTFSPGDSGPSGVVLGAYEWAYVVSLTSAPVSGTHLDTDSWAAIADIPGYVPGPGNTYFDPWVFDGFLQPYVQSIVETTDSPRFGADSSEYDVELLLGPTDNYPDVDLGMLYIQSTISPLFPPSIGDVAWQLVDDQSFEPVFGDGTIELPGRQVPPGEVPEASSVVATAAMGLLGIGYWTRRRRQTAAA